VEPGKRGIRFNDDNYWYIDSNASAAFKLGGDAENYIQWNGQAFIVQGDLRAKKGNFSGHVEIKSGGSLFSGVMNANQSNITGAGYILNSTGLKFSSASTPDITTISGTTGRFVTSSAEIGGWTVDTNSIYSSNITLKSGSTPGATSIVATNSGSYVGIRPRSTAGSDIVLWAGTVQPQNLVANNAASGQAGFQVNADGQLYATGAIISGKITVESGSSLGGLLNDTSKIYYGSSTPTVPAGGHKSGDAWVDTGNNNVLKVWNTSVTPAAWTVAQDSESVRTIANLKNRTFYAAQLTSPLRPNLSETFVSGDLWLNSSNKNKPYRYDGSSWVEVSDTDAANALSKADSALSKVTDYENRFGTGVNAGLIQDLKVNTQGKGIYSSYVESGITYAKSSYDSTTTGFYIGWDGTAGVVYPALNIGNANAFVKWNSRGTGTLEVKGTIKATSGSFDGNVTAGAGAITIGPSGISTTSNKFSIDTAGNAYFSGTLQAGTILSQGTVTGSTITGGTIQTGDSNVTRRIVMGSAQPDRIDFYPKSGDDADTAGYLWVSDDAGSATLPGLVLRPPTKSTWSNPPIIKMTQTSAGGFLDLSAVQITLANTVRFTGYAYHTGNVAVAAVAHRNISAGTTAPSGGNTGDVYIQY
jgi:cytoskeletal protein CcmA (bactofilin family)